jgi:hypothetical protein
MWGWKECYRNRRKWKNVKRKETEWRGWQCAKARRKLVQGFQPWALESTGHGKNVKKHTEAEGVEQEEDRKQEMVVKRQEWPKHH